MIFTPLTYRQQPVAAPVAARYWRYNVISCTCGSHHPRVARIDFFDSTTSAFINLITYRTDNCGDLGGIPGTNPPCYSESANPITKDFTSTSTAITGCRFYHTTTAVRCATINILYSSDNVNFTALWTGNATTAPTGGCGLYTISLTKI